MAWQLIYTSAPRLLEAGRTGFGTVARHRAVSGMLVATVERLSQFARLPGHDPRRVVHAYRTVTVGASTFHVLSCLQDAGSDYSGRTNHLAHHLIAEAREIRALAGSGITPADVLLGMTWLSSWSKPPQFMDPGEEVVLSSFPALKSNAWAGLTGKPDSARLLCAAAMKGAYIIWPQAGRPLDFLRESLLHAPQSGWQTSFTTCLEPNDEVGDFRWIGLSAASPLRGQAETSNRTVLDLTQPAQLPMLPDAPPAAVVVEARDFAPAESPAVATPAKAAVWQELPTASTASSMGEWAAQPRKAAPKKQGKVLLWSMVVMGLLVLSSAGYFIWQQQRASDAKETLEGKVKRVWSEYVVDGQLPRTQEKIRQQENWEDGMQMLKAHEQYFKNVRSALNGRSSQTEISLPASTDDEIGDLSKALTEWQSMDGTLQSEWRRWTHAAEPLPLYMLVQKYHAWQKRRAEAWDQLAGQIRGLHEAPTDPTLRQELLKEVKEQVSARPADDHELMSLITLNEMLGPDHEVTHWMALLSELNGERQTAIATTVLSDEKLPQWLRDKARGIQKKQAIQAATTQMQADNDAKAAKAKRVEEKQATMADADSLEGTNPVFICFCKPGENPLSVLQKITLRTAPDMRIYVGGAWDKHPRPDGKSEGASGNLRKWIGETADGKLQFRLNFGSLLQTFFAFSNDGKIIHVPDNAGAAPDGYRLVAQSNDNLKVLFDLRVIPPEPKDGKAVLAGVLEVAAMHAEKVTLTKVGALLERLQFPGLSYPQFFIRHDGATAEQKIYGLTQAQGAGAVMVEQPQSATSPGPANNVKALEARIRELEEGISKDLKDFEENERSKNPDKIKSEKRNTYMAAKTKKESELAEVKQKLQSLESLPATQAFFVLEDGEYSLLEHTSGNTLICKLRIHAQDKQSNSKPAQP
jgi:hypothetical protein